MNKQEVIETLEKKRKQALDNFEYYRDEENEKYEKMNRARVDSYTMAIQLVEQIDEPQAEKVEVPDFVAEWIELCKEKADLSSCLNGHYEIGDGTIVRPRGLSETFYDWLSDYDHMHDLARAYLYGYEVEEEPQWVVRHGGTILYLQGFRNSLDGDIVKQWCSYDGCIKFTDKSKAEAVATLFKGSVEEA